MEQYETLFDMIDETNDPLQYTTEELNRYFEFNHLNSNIIEEDIHIEDYFSNALNNIQIVQEEEEQDDEIILSQKLSQLSTEDENKMTSLLLTKRQRTSSNSTTSYNNAKKIKINDTEMDTSDENTIDKNQIPTYLLTTNQLFIQMCQTIIQSNDSITIYDLQEIALIEHKIGALNLKKQLTNAYLKSILGELKESNFDFKEVDRCVWPIEVISLMLTHKKSSTVMSIDTTKEEIDIENKQHVCKNLLLEQLREIDIQINHLQKQLENKKKSLVRFTSTIDSMIQNYIQQYGLKLLQIKNDFKLAIVNHNYNAEILQRLYLKENPNNYQMETMKRLLNAKRTLEKSRAELLELKQTIFYKKLPYLVDSLHKTEPEETTTIINENDQDSYLNGLTRVIQCKELESLVIQIEEIERKHSQNQKIFNAELVDIWSRQQHQVPNRTMSPILLNLLKQYSNNITDRWRDIYNYRVNYYLRNNPNHLDQMNNNNKLENIPSNEYISTVIIDTKHSLTTRQIELLNRGPTYVPPCQMYVLSASVPMNDLIKRQYAPLKDQLIHIFSKYNLNQDLSVEIQKKIFDQFSQLFSIPIPSDLQQRAMYENKLIQSIQDSLKKNNLILRRTSNNMNMFYLGNRNDFETKTHEYLSKSDIFQMIFIQDHENKEESMQNKLKEIIESMNNLILKDLKGDKIANSDLYKKLFIDINQVQLPYAYFLPDISKENELSLVPYISSQHSITWHIAQFLNQILQPFVDKILESITFRDEMDFMNKLNQYANIQKRLKPKTLFCTIKITNFSSLDNHPNMIETIGNFLETNLSSKTLGDLSISSIKTLLNVFLHHNIFCYKDKIYQFIKGSPNTMALSETLANIYLSVWQKKISDSLKDKQELFGRYKDEIFFTWNQANVDEIRHFLQTVKETYPQVQFQRLIGPCVEYLNAYIENQRGILYSRINHNSISDQYMLPYVTGHSKLAYSDWLQSALLRTVCYCSLVDDFNRERIYLELSYLINGYSVEFIDTHIQHFFNYFHVANKRYTMNQAAYDKFRQRCFNYVQIKHERQDQFQAANNQILHFNYIYEYGPRCQFNQQFYELWNQYFNDHPLLSQKQCSILLKTNHFRSLNDLFTQ